MTNTNCFACLTDTQPGEQLKYSEYYDEEVCQTCFIDGQDKQREEEEEDQL